MNAKQHILQVSELTKKVRFLLESELNTVWLSGEISNFIAASSGHWYLSLKDSRSQVKCAMFKGSNSRVRIKPKNGQQVLVRAKVSLYEPRGDFQLIIEHMDDAGDGLLMQQFEALKAKLNAEGLFSQYLKKPLPKRSQRIGVITSPTGAAIKDILTVLKRRSPNSEVIIYPALVQGELAASDIVGALQKANQRDECDVLIVGRGGGSLEDLWCFNQEVVVRAIAQSNIPIVSAVGHEVDTTLSDYVADLRAPTPSAAAELVSSDNKEQQDKISGLTQRLNQLINSTIKFHQQQQSHNSSRLVRLHPQQQLEQQFQHTDLLKLQLSKAMTTLLQQKAHQPEKLTSNLSHLSPINYIQQQQGHSQHLSERLVKVMKNKIQGNGVKFGQLAEQLHIVSPLATIARGYSVTRDKTGQIIRSIEQVKEQDNISVQLNDGRLTATVTSKVNRES